MHLFTDFTQVKAEMEWRYGASPRQQRERRYATEARRASRPGARGGAPARSADPPTRFTPRMVT